MRLRNAKDLLAGLLFFAFGLGFLYVAQDYPLGSARRMGPAYFPVVLSFILVGIGLATIVRAWLVPGPPIRNIAGKALAVVTASIILFGLLVPGAGLAIAVAALVGVSAAASQASRPLATLMLALIAAAFCVLAFVHGLGLPFPALGSWFGG